MHRKKFALKFYKQFITFGQGSKNRKFSKEIFNYGQLLRNNSKEIQEKCINCLGVLKY